MWIRHDYLYIITKKYYKHATHFRIFTFVQYYNITFLVELSLLINNTLSNEKLLGF